MTTNSQAEVGYITSVYTDDGRVFVDVALPRPGANKSRVPFLQLAPGVVVTPAETQQVLIQKLADGNVIASFPLTGSALLPDLGEGELAFVFDENTKIHVNRKWDGTTDVSVSASGQTNIHAEGDVNITGGNVVIDGIDFDQHTHDVSYSWTDAGGSSTTTSDSPQ
jgi:hypothetical protein